MQTPLGMLLRIVGAGLFFVLSVSTSDALIAQNLGQAPQPVAYIQIRKAEIPAVESTHSMRKNRSYLFVYLFGGITLILFVILAVTTVRNVMGYKSLAMQNALTQGYWIAQFLEVDHSMLVRDHATALRDIIQDIEQRPNVRFLIVLDAGRNVMIASDITLAGMHWPHNFGNPPEMGSIIKNDGGTLELVFPTFFVRARQRMLYRHPDENSPLADAKWIVLGLDASEAQAHYQDMLMQSAFVSLGISIFGLVLLWFFGIIQRYKLASASIEKLEHIKQGLAKFVPGTVQRLIEANPQQPMLDKVEHQVTVLFLDIDHYTVISAHMSPTALNRLVETYFAAFLDIILSYHGEINETAGDGIMAIFTGKTPQTHALNAVRTAIAIKELARTLNHKNAPHAPEILVNIGINTGLVLLGATMFKGVKGERFTYTASGMVTNIAARLCGLGTKGEIHLSSTTAYLVAGHVTLYGPFEVPLKNIPDPVLVYAIEKHTPSGAYQEGLPYDKDH